jgi:hypothetical protein
MECLGRTDLHALRFSNPVLFTEITDHAVIMIRRVKTWYGGRAGSSTLATGGSQTPVDVYDHVGLLFVVINHRGIHGTGLLTLPLFLRTLAADVLHGFRDWQMISEIRIRESSLLRVP